MTPERWERLKMLFHGALEQAPAARGAWLTSATAGDEALQADVAALLEAHDTADDFLEVPVQIDPADLQGPDPDAVVSGFSRTLGPYEIQGELGRGGMGVVYLARDTRLDRLVALKSLPPGLQDPRQRERLRREARAAATIAHRGVAIVYALEELDDRLFIASEYIPGRTLRTVINAGPIDPARATAITGEIARAVQAAHAAGVVHRDLKPENALVTDGGTLKIVDFGIAHIEASAGTRLTLDGAMLGSPAYMAPEQLAGEQADARSDLYAIGVIFAEMLTGRHPFAPGAPPLPRQLQTIVARCIAADPAARYQSASELLRALSSVSSTAGDESPPSIAHQPSTTNQVWWWRFHQAAAAVVYGAMLVPIWAARGIIGGTVGRVLFFAALAAVVTASTLRLHLWFTSVSDPAALRRLRQRARPAIRASDWLFVLALSISGLFVGDRRASLAGLLIAVGVGVAVAFLAIEPATTRAAFRSRPPDNAELRRV